MSKESVAILYSMDSPYAHKIHKYLQSSAISFCVTSCTLGSFILEVEHRMERCLQS